MIDFKSEPFSLSKDIGFYYDYLLDLNHYQNLFPEDLISNWLSSSDEFSFKVKDTYSVCFRIEERVENQYILLKNQKGMPIQLRLEFLPDKKMVVQGQAKVNPFLKSMLKKPLEKLFSTIQSNIQAL